MSTDWRFKYLLTNETSCRSNKTRTSPLRPPPIPIRAKFFNSSHPIAPHPTCKKMKNKITEENKTWYAWPCRATRNLI